MSDVSFPADSEQVYSSVRSSILEARSAACRAVNSAVVFAYWDVGRQIYEAAGCRAEYGAELLKFLSKRLVKEFGGGFSVPNLRNMRQFYLVYQKRYALRSELSWTHYRLLMRVEDDAARSFYEEVCVSRRWSSRQLEHYIGLDLYSLQKGKFVSNFDSAIPEMSDECAAVFKDRYVFDFLELGKVFDERRLEDSLVNEVVKMLMEFGSGFAFVGRQVHLEVGGDDFYIDLLFYHLKLHCYVVVDLKSGKFTPEFAGKMNFYLSAVDDLIKSDEDKRSIGLILCKDKRGLVAEYALRDLHKPLGVSEYVLASDLPEDLRRVLPGAEDFGEGVLREMGVVYRRKRNE